MGFPRLEACRGPPIPTIHQEPLGRKPMKGKALEEQKRLELLEEAAQAIGIEVRYEPFKGENAMATGGLCRLKGNYLLIINQRAGLGERINAIASAINRFDLSTTYLRPGLREFLEGFPAEKGDAVLEQE